MHEEGINFKPKVGKQVNTIAFILLLKKHNGKLWISVAGEAISVLIFRMALSTLVGIVNNDSKSDVG